MSRRIAKRAGGPTYTEKLCSVTKLLESHEHELLTAELDALQLQTKEMVLVDLVKHQQVLAAMLQQDMAMEQEDSNEAAVPQPSDTFGSSNITPTSSIFSIRVDECCPQPVPSRHHDCSSSNGACSGHVTLNDKPFAHLNGDSLVIQLFRSVTNAMLQKVKAMTKEDWMEYFKQMFFKVSILLQVLSHASEEDWLQAAQQQDAEMSMQPGQASAAASLVSPQQQHVPAAATSKQNALRPNGNAAGPAKQPYELLSACPDGYVPGVCLAQDMLVLDALIHEMELMMLLAVAFNPIPLYASCTVNLATGEFLRPPPAVRHQVASKIMLSDQQAQQLSVSLEDFKRSSRVSNAQCAGLVQEAADGGVLVALLARQMAGTTEQQEVHEHAAAQQETAAGRSSTAATGLKRLAAARQRKKRSRTAGKKNCSSTAEVNVQVDTVLDTQDIVPVAEVELDAEDILDLDNQLRRNSFGRQLQHMSQSMLLVNTLTTLQIASLVVASYPAAILSSTVDEAVQMHMQQKEAAKLGVEEKRGPYWCHVQERHDRQRMSLLQAQQRKWWQELRERQV